MSNYNTPNGRSAKRKNMSERSSLSIISERVSNADKKTAKRTEEVKRQQLALKTAMANPETNKKHQEHQDSVRLNKENLEAYTKAYKAEYERIMPLLEDGNVSENIKKMAYLKELSDKIVALTQQSKDACLSEYDKLLEQLALKNPNYVIYINPMRFTVYDKLEPTVNRLDAKHLAMLQARLENSEAGNLFDEKNKVKLCPKYFRMFRDCLNRLNTLEDIIRYAVKYPEEFQNVVKYLKKAEANQSIPFGGENLGTILGTILVKFYNKNKNYSIFEHFSIADMHTLAKEKPNMLGSALAEYPEVIISLPANFFKTYSYKTVFRDVNKSEYKKNVIECFKDDLSVLDKFDPEFKKWLFKDYESTVGGGAGGTTV